MKKLYPMVACAALVLTGCANTQMMDQKMQDMNMQMSEMQFQLNSAETAAARAKEMATEAMIKASRLEHAMMKKMGRKKMKQMMK